MKDENGSGRLRRRARRRLAVHDGAARPFYDPRAVARAGAPRRHVPDRPRRHLRGSDHVGRASGARGAHEHGCALAHQRRSRLAQPVLARRVELRRRCRGRRGEGGLRRDPVRLRPLPERRRRLDHPIPGRAPAARAATVAAFLRTRRPACIRSAYACRRTSSACRRRTTSASARTRREIGKVVDTIYPMTYPSHYSSGEFNLPDPNAAPGQTVLGLAHRLPHEARRHGGALLVPGCRTSRSAARTRPADVAAQVAAARSFHTGGFMLWNAGGIYTARELGPARRRRCRRWPRRRSDGPARSRPAGCMPTIQPCSRLS